MESPFTYNCTASGNSFLARKKEVSQTVLNIRSRVHTVIYEPPKTGKQSLIDMALAQTGLTPAVIDMISMIDSDELLHALQDTPEHTLVYKELSEHTAVAGLGESSSRSESPDAE